MINRIKQYSLLLGFTATSVVVVYCSMFDVWKIDDQDFVTTVKSDNTSINDSYLKDVRYFNSLPTRPNFNFVASELILHGDDNKIVAFSPKGSVFDETGREIGYQSKNISADVKNKKIYLENDVEINVDLSKLKARLMVVNLENSIIKGSQGVQVDSSIESTKDVIKISADSFEFYPAKKIFSFLNDVDGIVQRQKQYEESVTFKANRLVLDGLTKQVELIDNVALKRGTVDLSARKGEILLDNYNKRLKYYALYDDVRLRELVSLDGRVLERKAYAEKMEGITSEGKIVLSGYPKVYQGQDVIRGNKITLREQNESVEVEDANTNFIMRR